MTIGSLSYRSISDFNDHDRAQVVEAIKTIFFVSSSVTEFSSHEKKEGFYKKWCGDYLTFYPEFFYVYIDLESLRVYGYICGVIDTQESLGRLSIPGALVFADLYQEFPAHLHINLHPDARGMGVGTKLVREFINTLKGYKISGLHLITSKDSENTRFYERLGFDVCHERLLNDFSLFFMGKKFENKKNE